MTRIYKLYGIDNPKIYDAAVDYGKTSATVKIESSRAVGIEVEVENAKVARDFTSRVWTATNDGSLRNQGLEFVTKPIPAKWAPHALRELLGECLDNKECCFSPRTSIHVHVDVSQENDADVIGAVQLYSVFERQFFRYVGRGRSKNIYCVPITESACLAGIGDGHDSTYAHGSWSKYSALNLIPLNSYGTLEFRHMHGSFDLLKVSTWVRMLVTLIDWACAAGRNKVSTILQSMDENYNYNALLDEIFGEDAYHLKVSNYNEVKFCVGRMFTSFAKHSTIQALAVNRSANAPFFQPGV